MKILYPIILCFLFLEGTKAQCLQDTLFQRQLKWNPKEFVVGEKYTLQSGKKNSKSDEYGKSPLVKANEVPEFDHSGQPLNAIYYNEIGNSKLTFLGLTEDETYVIGEATFLFNVLNFECEGKHYKYFKTNRINNTDVSQYADILYNNLISLSILEKIEETLVGKTMYVLIPVWFKDKRKSRSINLPLAEDNTCKYCPVEITAVEKDYADQFTVYFKRQNSDEIFCFPYLMFGEKELHSSMNFLRKMTFEDPKNKYPKISNKKWEIIQEQRIEKGLTTEEVKIAFGKPDEIHTKNGNDTWVYYNSNEKDYVVTFKKGKVIEYYIGPASRYLQLIF